MANLFSAINVPAGDGAGVALDISSFGPDKTVIIGGVFVATVAIQVRADIADDWVTVGTFDRPSNEIPIRVAALEVRTVISNFVSGVPVVNIGAEAIDNQFVTVPIPAGDGVGAAISTALMGKRKTIYISGIFVADVEVELSEDNGVTFAPFVQFDRGGQLQAVDVTSQTARVRIVNRRSGNPVVRIAAADDLTAEAGDTVANVTVTEFGAKGDGVTDDAASIQAAIDAVCGMGGGTVLFPPGLYEVKSQINIDCSRITLIGSGRQATIVRFNPTVDNQTLFKFSHSNPLTVLVECGIRNMTLTSSLDTGLTKTALELHDSSNFILRNIIIDPWTGNSDSVGLRLKGRDFFTLHSLRITADRPVRIEQNDRAVLPNDLDHCHFQDCFFIVTGVLAEPCIFVEDGANMQNVRFDGYQSWVKGSHGFFWQDTTSADASLALSFENVRSEQGVDATAYTFYIERNTVLQNLSITDCVMDLGRRGMFLRNINHVSIKECLYNGAGEAINADSVDSMVLDEVSPGTLGSLVIPNMIEKFSFHRRQGPDILPTWVFLAEPASDSLVPVELFQTKLWAQRNATLADGADLAINADDNTGRDSALILVTAHSAVGPIIVGGLAIDTPDGAVIGSAIGNFTLVDAAPNLALLNLGATTVLRNRTGQTLEIAVMVFWIA